MLKQIVVGTDGSNESLTAFEQALQISERIGCGIKCVFIVDLRKTQMPFIYSGGSYEGAFERLYIPPDSSLKNFYAKLTADLDEFAGRCMATCREKAKGKGVPFESVVKTGYPGMELCDEARAGGLLVVGQRGENAHYRRSIVGSITEDLIRTSPRPLLICPETTRTIRRVLCPYDGSRTAENALQFIVNRIKDIVEDLVLVLVGEEDQTERHVEEEVLYLQKHSISVRIVTKNGVPSKEILKAAEEEETDLIVIGAHGRHRFKDYVLGSNASHVVHKSQVPVLVVF